MIPKHFRVWDNYQKKYIATGVGIVGEFTAFGMMDITIDETWKERSEAMGYTRTLQAWNDFEFEQFIGLTDKDGNNIYECDRVRITGGENYHGMRELDQICTIEFSYGSFCAVNSKGVHYDIGMIEDLEVIGNIHDNQ